MKEREPPATNTDNNAADTNKSLSATLKRWRTWVEERHGENPEQIEAIMSAIAPAIERRESSEEISALAFSTARFWRSARDRLESTVASASTASGEQDPASASKHPPSEQPENIRDSSAPSTSPGDTARPANSTQESARDKTVVATLPSRRHLVGVKVWAIVLGLAATAVFLIMLLGHGTDSPKSMAEAQATLDSGELHKSSLIVSAALVIALICFLLPSVRNLVACMCFGLMGPFVWNAPNLLVILVISLFALFFLSLIPGGTWRRRYLEVPAAPLDDPECLGVVRGLLRRDQPTPLWSFGVASVLGGVVTGPAIGLIRLFTVPMAVVTFSVQRQGTRPDGKSQPSIAISWQGWKLNGTLEEGDEVVFYKAPRPFQINTPIALFNKSRGKVISMLPSEMDHERSVKDRLAFVLIGIALVYHVVS